MKKSTSAKPEYTSDAHATDLEANPHLFKQVLNASGMAMSIRDKDLRLLFANQTFLDLSEYSLEELRDNHPSVILPQETYSLFTNEIRPTIMAGNNWEGECTMRTKGGRNFRAWMRFDPVLDEHGTMTHTMCLMRDATETMRLRNALTQTERHLQFLAENTSDCLFRLRLSDGKYDYISSAIESITGYPPADFYATPRLFERLSPEDWTNTFNFWWSEFLRGKCRYEYESPLIHKDDSLKWVNQRITLVKDDDGIAIAIEGIITDITTRKQAEENLATAQKSLNFISESTSDIFFRMGVPSGEYEYISPSVKGFSGYTAQEHLSTSFFALEILHPDWQEYFHETWNEILRGIVRPEYIYQIIHKSGDIRWVSQRSVLHKDEHGQPVAIEGIVSDITLQKEADTIIHDSEARYRTLFEDSPISLWEEDLTRLKTYFDECKSQGITDFRKHFHDNPAELAKCATLVDVVGVNKATLDLLKARSTDDLIGNLEKILTESSMAAFTEEMILLASGGYEYCGELTHRTLEGDIIWVMVHFSVPPEYQDTFSRVIVSLIDVTPRKRAEEALINSEERYRILGENAQDGVVVIQNGMPKYINEGMTDILEFSAHELKQIHPLKLIHPDDKTMVLEQLNTFVSGKNKEGFASFRVITKSKKTKWLTLTIKPILWEGAAARLKIFTDVTVHKTLEKELRRAHIEMEERVKERTLELSKTNLLLMEEAEQKERAQKHILSLTQQLIRIQEDERQRIARDLHDNVAQDLSSIVLQLETLFDGHDPKDTEIKIRGEAIKTILQGAVASVRDISYGLSPPALDELGLAQALENHCQDAALKANIAVDCYATGIESIHLDFDTEINIYRMVQEAITNMIKHSHASKGTIRIVKSHPDILIRIEDNGLGFDLTKRRTEAAEEKRMGLRSMKERARLLGGSMEIQSLPGTGTRIIFKIPIDNARRRG